MASVSCGGQGCILQKLAKENDELLKIYMDDLLCGKTSATVSRHLCDMENLILRLQGLPVQDKVTQLEAAVLFNYGIAKLHFRCLHLSQSHSKNDMDLKVKKHLQRVGFLVKGKSIAKQLPVQPDERLKGAPCNVHVISVLLVQALNCFLGKDFTSTHEILNLASDCFTKLKASENQESDVLTFPAEGLFVGVLPKLTKDQFVEVKCSTYLALAIISAKMCDYSTALSHLQTVTFESYEDHCALIKGYCLYCQRNYSEALSALFKRDGIISQCLSNAFCYLKALCYHKQHKVELAIQQLKHSLVSDFAGQTTSLQLLSQLFGTTGMKNVQIETLQLLVKKLKQEKDGKHNSKQQNFAQMTLNAFLISLFQNEVTLNEALYSLGKTCLVNERYEASGKAYLELVNNILKSGIAFDNRKDEETIVTLPATSILFVESAEALVRANRPKEAIAVCDHLLERSSRVIDATIIVEQSNFIEGVQTNGASNTKKRNLSLAEVDLLETEDDIVAMISTLKLKAEALLMLSDTENSLQCINRCLQCFEDYCDRNGNSVENKKLSPPRKCQKLEEGASSEERTDPLIEHIMSDVYSCMARILMTKNNHKLALHWSRMALCSKPGNKDYKELHASISNYLIGSKRPS